MHFANRNAEEQNVTLRYCGTSYNCFDPASKRREDARLNPAKNQGESKVAEVVNLDALIPREDFLGLEKLDVGQDGKNEISRTDLLRKESFFLTLRKPDFQRETAAWSPEAVCDFIKAFVDRELIPSVICWESPTRLSFVIDGGHRLSAIIAWLQDDYGDGDTSIKFYKNEIPDEQKRIAKKNS